MACFSIFCFLSFQLELYWRLGFLFKSNKKWSAFFYFIITCSGIPGRQEVDLFVEHGYQVKWAVAKEFWNQIYVTEIKQKWLHDLQLFEERFQVAQVITMMTNIFLTISD